MTGILLVATSLSHPLSDTAERNAPVRASKWDVETSIERPRGTDMPIFHPVTPDIGYLAEPSRCTILPLLGPVVLPRSFLRTGWLPPTSCAGWRYILENRPGHPEVLGLGREGLPAVLDSFSHFSHINTRLVHISRVV